MMNMNIKKFILSGLKYAMIICWSVIILFPLLIVVFGSFKTYSEFTNTQGLALPESFLNFENYKIAFQKGNMLVGFINSFILVICGVIGSVLIGSMVAFIINRFDFKFKKWILFMYLLVSIVPMEISQVSTFKIISSLGIYNTRLAPILLYIGADVVMIYIYLQMIEKIPRDLDKAVILEGGSIFQVYRKVIFPLLKPATATAALLKVISIYNDFYIPYLYMPGEKLNTVSTALYNFIGPAKTDWQVICAAIIISIIPMVIFIVFLQKHIYSGITSGSIK